MALVELNDTGEPQRRFFGLLRARPPASDEEAAAAMTEPAYALIEGDPNTPVDQHLVPPHMQPAMYIDPNQTAAAGPGDAGPLATTALAQGDPLAQVPQPNGGVAQHAPIPQQGIPQMVQQAVPTQPLPVQQMPAQQMPAQQMVPQAMPQQAMPPQVLPQQMAPQQLPPQQMAPQPAGPPPGMAPQHFNAQGVPLQPVPAHLVPQHALAHQPVAQHPVGPQSGPPVHAGPPQMTPPQHIAVQQGPVQQVPVHQGPIEAHGQAPVGQPPVGLAQGMVPPHVVQQAQPAEDPAAMAAAAMAETSEIARGPLDAPTSFLAETGAFERQIFAPNFELIGQQQGGSAEQAILTSDEPIFSGSTYPAVSVAPVEPNVATIQQSSPFEETIAHSTHVPVSEPSSSTTASSTPTSSTTASSTTASNAVSSSGVGVGQVEFFSVEIDLQPIERSILRNEQVHAVMVDGPERYIAFLSRSLAIVARNFPDVLIMEGGQPLDCLIRVVDDNNAASYSLPDVMNRRLASIAQQVSTRGPGSISESVQGCPVGISVIDRAGPALGFSTTVGSHRLALTLTGVDHRPFASVDRAGCSAMSVHATGVIGAAFAAVVSADRRQAFVEELKLVIETRDWDTELD